MKKLLTFVFMFTVSTLVTANEKSAIDWLQVVDQGKYQHSWKLSGRIFQQMVTADKWQSALDQVRKPLGASLSREIVSQTEHKKLPGLPAGKYQVFIFKSAFENKALAQETLTLSYEDSDWKAIGYFIK